MVEHTRIQLVENLLCFSSNLAVYNFGRSLAALVALACLLCLVNGHTVNFLLA